MRIICPCGHLILDRSFNSIEKAYLIAEQDDEKFYGDIEAAFADLAAGTIDAKACQRRVTSAYSDQRFEAFQCPKCGRILIDRGSKSPEPNRTWATFAPDSPDASHFMLRGLSVTEPTDYEPE